jgi:hypothetical protein
VSSRAPSRSFSSRAARQHALDNDTSYFPSDYNGSFHTHGGYPPNFNTFVSPHSHSYNSNPMGTYPGGFF